MSDSKTAKDDRRAKLPECHEGKGAASNFAKALKTVLGVSKQRITTLESKAHKERCATA